MKKFTTTTAIPQEIISVWEAAWARKPTIDDPLVIEMLTKQEAVNFRQMLYAARTRMQEANYKGAANWSKLEISVKGEAMNILHIRVPNWLKVVNETLDKEGIVVPPESVPHSPIVAGGGEELSRAVHDFFQQKAEEQ